MNTRSKGVKGEREVAKLWQAAGFEVRGLEAGGDHFIVSRGGRTLHAETKRHERLRIPEWLAQVERDTPQGLPFVLAFRQTRRRWYAVQPLEEVIIREARLAELEAQVAASRQAAA